ncbi:MAG: hypothetical protein ACXVB1_10610 [Pseudobdellovibrionaceae bacterium]
MKTLIITLILLSGIAKAEMTIIEAKNYQSLNTGVKVEISGKEAENLFEALKEETQTVNDLGKFKTVRMSGTSTTNGNFIHCYKMSQVKCLITLDPNLSSRPTK